mgnify:FL=1
MKMRKKINLSNRIVLINKKFKKKEFYHYFKTPNLSLVIPIYKNKFIIVSQKRIPINKINYEFPSGLIEKKETLLQSAKKELLEETGYKCIGKLHKLISCYTDPGRITTMITGFYTNRLKKISKPEKGINIHFVSKDKLLKLIKQKKFNTAAHIAMFLHFLNK